MKKILKRLIIVIITLIIGYYAVGAFAVFMLTYFANPRLEPLTEKEIPIMNSIKQEFNVNKIVRIPERKKDFPPRFKGEYGVIVENAICGKPNKKEEVYLKAKAIANEFENKLNLHPNFILYEIDIFCENNDYYFKFNRDSLKLGLYDVPQKVTPKKKK